ncbi:hypothetical protein ColTof4_13856 [Colletotrichum tofieldiae]|nr:hypothetical protein ColTof3_03411 [Colletotrichum tofieldiae]GKT81433.1 hypothetical protein ColTof4_13856 [Colletotrichum tofieldiae]
MFVGNQLSHSHVEAELNRLTQAVHRGADDESLNIVCDGTDNDTDDGDDITSNKEPASAEKI